MQLTAVRTKDTTAHGKDPAARGKETAAPAGRTGVRDANGMAVASFILGLLGLLVLNVVLGPIAIALAAVALWRGTTRRGRALLGLGLGVADLVLLVTFMQLDHTVSWSF
ncbi:DUF4190 domain-containing protein [Streptomyces sp. NPDC058960]|uniref:DUF4190 domain-containing protein n=1 Tax=Streptomyces sp. NPDC058960 TaxID=3346679 RepID=UPI0036C53760